MKDKIVRIVVAVLLAFMTVGLTVAKESATVSAADAANHFYRTYLKLNPRGLPTKDQMKELAPLFSPSLIDLIEAARREQEKEIRAHPDEKAPWAEGNLFASLYEGVTSFRLGKPVLCENKASFPAYLEFHDQRDPGPIEWIDVIVLEKSGDQWLVWDIFLNGPWAFREGPSLRGILSVE